MHVVLCGGQLLGSSPRLSSVCCSALQIRRPDRRTAEDMSRPMPNADLSYGYLCSRVIGLCGEYLLRCFELLRSDRTELRVALPS